MNSLNDLVDVALGSIPLNTGDLAKIDATADARGATREAVIRLLIRTGIRDLPEVTQ